MRNKILRRTVILMAIAMFLVSAAIVAAFIVVSLNQTEQEVKEFSEPVVDQISRLDNLGRLDVFVANKQGSSIRITIYNSNGDAAWDTYNKSELKYTDIYFDDQISSIMQDNIGATRSKYTVAYSNSRYNLFTYYVKVKVNDKVDKDEFLIVRFSKSGVTGSQPFCWRISSILDCCRNRNCRIIWN